MTKQEEIREEIAELEHKQWVAWSKSLAKAEHLDYDRLERWMKLWIPYAELTEEQKDQDRIWADKSLNRLHLKGVVIRAKCPDCVWSQFGDESVGMTPCGTCDSTGYIIEPLIK